MLVINYTTLKNNFKDYCDKATNENEDIIITRKDEKNLVLVSLEKYNQLMKSFRNAEYLYKIDCSMAQLKAGKGQLHELIESDVE